MNIRTSFVPFLLGSLFFVNACKLFGRGSETTSFQEEVLVGKDLALEPGELALTFDDGPSQFSLGLAKVLEKNQIPAVYFVNFHNQDKREYTVHLDQDQGRNTIKEICKMSTQILASHGDKHDFNLRNPKSIEKTTLALMELCPKPYYFIRFPGGIWDSPKERLPFNETMIPGQNIRYGELYVGPVNWDITGEDWSRGCQNNINKCRDSYIEKAVGSEPGKCRGGIMLFHDIYPTTMELVLGKNWKNQLADANLPLENDSMIRRLMDKGCRFASIAKSELAIEKLLGEQPLPDHGVAEAISDFSFLYSVSGVRSVRAANEKCKIEKGSKFSFQREPRSFIDAQYKVTLSELPKSSQCSELFGNGKTSFFYGSFFKIESQYAKSE